MCLLCAVQRWSRRVAGMLPWLVVPLLGLWALSQFFPPGLRFEVNYPRLACVLVLLATLCWYEVAMPRLSAWRARRSAMLRQRHLSRAAELHKLRRAATRRCRNCLLPYRDQNPSGGGRFMCSSCGHVSRRPVLDLPGPAASSGLLASWLCATPELPRRWAGSGVGDDWFSSEKPCSSALLFVTKLVLCVFFGARWLWGLVFRKSEDSSDPENKGSSKKGENGGCFQETRGEKARRKAEEKRLARLEKEMLEEEERKQREEVARLVEERRKLRDEKLEAERRRSKSLGHDGEKDNGRGVARRRQERRKEREKGSSKSNSDVDETEKRPNRESEKKCDFDKKSESEKRDSQKLEAGHGTKVATNKPTRYFDRMKGSLLSSSRSFSGVNFFGRSSQTSALAPTKTSPPVNGFVDHGQKYGSRSAYSTGLISSKHISNGNDKTSDTKLHSQMVSDLPPRQPAPKRSWHSLFIRSSSVYPCPDASGSVYTNQNDQVGAQTAQSTDKKMWPDVCLDNQFDAGQLLPFPLYSSNVDGTSVSHLVNGSMFPPCTDQGRNFLLEEAEIFEDPCYIPDPVSLLGPVSESLDSFPLDLGPGFLANSKVEEPRIWQNVPAFADGNKPSPIEAPMSRSRTSHEKHMSSVQLPHSLMSRDASNIQLPHSLISRDASNIQLPHSLMSRDASNMDESGNKHQEGTWQMWGTPLVQDALSFIGGPRGNPSPGQNKSNHRDMLHPLSGNYIASHISEKNHVFPGSFSPQNVQAGILQNGTSFGPLDSGLNESNVWMHKPVLQPYPVEGNQIPPLNLMNDFNKNEVTCAHANISVASCHFDAPSTCWSKRDWVLDGQQDTGNSTTGRPQSHARSPFTTNPDAQSFWS